MNFSIVLIFDFVETMELCVVECLLYGRGHPFDDDISKRNKMEKLNEK